MKMNRISETIGSIDEKYIAEAAEYAESGGYRKKNIFRWGAVAACLTALITVSAFAIPSFSGAGTNSASENGESDSKYKDFQLSGGEVAIVWPWEYMTVYEQYYMMTFNGNKYSGNRTASGSSFVIDSSLVGDHLGTCEAIGYDDYSDGKEYRRDFEVYEIEGVSAERLAAVYMDGEYYVFGNYEYSPPATLGDMLEQYDLPDTLELKRFSICEGYDTEGHYTVADDGPIWEILSDCGNAEFAEKNTIDWSVAERNYLSFTATSEALGSYKKVFHITEDGYISTNFDGWGYLYYIGEDAANRIIDYATKNSVEAESEPYQYNVLGEVTEINDGYVLIDDSVLCKNPDDGIIYKLPTDDIRILRCFEFGGIGVGDIVVVTCDDDFYIDSDNTIHGAVSVDEGRLVDGGVAVQE